MDLGLKDKLIVVTGGGAGIGAGISRACLAEGARVVVLGRRSENVQAFMVEMQATDAQCTLMEAHLEDLDRCQSAIAEIEERSRGYLRAGEQRRSKRWCWTGEGKRGALCGEPQQESDPLLRAGSLCAAFAEADAGSDCEHQFEGCAYRAGQYVGVRGEQGRAACAYARVGRGTAALQHSRERRSASGGDDSALSALAGYAGRSGGGAEADHRQDSAGPSDDAVRRRLRQRLCFCCRQRSRHTPRASTSLWMAGMCTWIAR